MKILFHINASENWEMVLNNVTNTLQSGENTAGSLEIAIVANGAAVRQLQETEAEQSKIRERFIALPPSVQICACNNALKNLAIPPQHLLPFIRVVANGVVEIALRQQRGYAYIKP